MGYWAAGAAIVGDVMAQQGASATNATSMDIAMANNRFNARQAQINRTFQDTESSTMMQRRVQDLQAANLNPALAYQQGGAAAMPGSTASAAANPQLQNPNAAYGNIGSQMASALGLRTQEAQIEQMQADANKKNVEAGTEVPAMVDKIHSETGLNNIRAAEAGRNVQMLDMQLGNIAPEGPYGSIVIDNAAITNLKMQLSRMDVQQQQDTLQLLIKARNDVNLATSIGALNLASVSDGDWGKLMALFNISKPVISTASQVAGAAVGFMP